MKQHMCVYIYILYTRLIIIIIVIIINIYNIFIDTYILYIYIYIPYRRSALCIPMLGFPIEGGPWRYNLLQLETTRWAQSWPGRTCRAA
jgi:hypothetical protein